MSVSTQEPPIKLVNFGEQLLTLDGYYAMSAVPFFADKRTELLEGRMVVMPLPGEMHNFVTDQVESRARVWFAGWNVRREKGFVIPPDTDAGPDVAVVRESAAELARVGRPSRAVWIAEVAVSTFHHDAGYKASLYAGAGVPEYWVFDVERRRVVIFSNPLPAPDGDDAGYADRRELSEDELVAPREAAAAPCRVREFFLPG